MRKQLFVGQQRLRNALTGKAVAISLEGRLRLQRLDQRCHLDGFGPGAENQKNFLCHLKSPCASSGGGRVLVYCKDGACVLARSHAFTLNQCFAFMPAGIVCPLVKYQAAAIGWWFLALRGIIADVLAGSGEERQICFYLRFINWGNHGFKLISGFAKALNHSEETHDERT